MRVKKSLTVSYTEIPHELECKSLNYKAYGEVEVYTEGAAAANDISFNVSALVPKLYNEGNDIWRSPFFFIHPGADAIYFCKSVFIFQHPSASKTYKFDITKEGFRWEGLFIKNGISVVNIGVWNTYPTIPNLQLKLETRRSVASDGLYFGQPSLVLDNSTYALNDLSLMEAEPLIHSRY